METDNSLNQYLNERINNLQQITLNRLYRTLNLIRRMVNQANLPIGGYQRFKREYQTEIEDMNRQLNDLKNDTTSDLETRSNLVGRLERQAIDLEENIFTIPSRLKDDYQPEEEEDPNEEEEEEEEENSQQFGGRRRHKYRKTKYRKTKHKSGKRKQKRKQKTRRNRNKY